MASKKNRRKKSSTFPILPVGLGLLLMGVAVLAFAAPRPDGNSASSSSVVPVSVSYAAPELSLQNLQGENESLMDYRGSVILVNNWATWCPPCKAEMPTLSAYYNEHHDQGFTIIAIEAGDPVDGVSQFVQSLDLKFPIWIDPEGASVRAFNNGTLPNSYVIDRSGTVRYAWTGEISRAMLEKYVTPLLAKNN